MESSCLGGLGAGQTVLVIWGIVILIAYILLCLVAEVKWPWEWSVWDKVKDFLADLKRHYYSKKIHRKGNRIGNKNPKFFIDYYKNLINLKDPNKHIVRQIPIEKLVIININPLSDKFYVWGKSCYNRKGLVKEFSASDIKVAEGVEGKFNRVWIDQTHYSSTGLREYVVLETVTEEKGISWVGRFPSEETTRKNYHHFDGIISDSFEELRNAIQEILNIMLEFPDVDQNLENFVHYNIILPGINDSVDGDNLLTYKSKIPVTLIRNSSYQSNIDINLGQIIDFRLEHGEMSFKVGNYNPNFLITEGEDDKSCRKGMDKEYDSILKIIPQKEEKEDRDSEEDRFVRDNRISNSITNVALMSSPS